MCIGGGGGGPVVQQSADTSTQPIKSKYPLTEAQKKENERRRKALLPKKSLVSLGEKGGDGPFSNNSPKSTSFSGFDDASGGFKV